jgi:hypothetical protein
MAGGCLLSPAKFSDALIRAFIERPTDLIERHPLGGLAMSAEVRRLAASDVATVAPIIGVAKGAAPAQVVAIGAGLAQAGELCSRFRVEVQRRIEQEVAAAGLSDLSAAFAVYKISPATSPVTIPAAEVTQGSPIGDGEGVSGAVGSGAPFGMPAPTTEEVSATARAQGPFGTSEAAMPFFAGRGGLGGGSPPTSDVLRLRLGEFSFTQTALPFFNADTDTGRDGEDSGTGGRPHGNGFFGPGGAPGFGPGNGLASSSSSLAASSTSQGPSTVFAGGGGGVTDTSRSVVSPTH